MVLDENEEQFAEVKREQDCEEESKQGVAGTGRRGRCRARRAVGIEEGKVGKEQDHQDSGDQVTCRENDLLLFDSHLVLFCFVGAFVARIDKLEASEVVGVDEHFKCFRHYCELQRLVVIMNVSIDTILLWSLTPFGRNCVVVDT